MPHKIGSLLTILFWTCLFSQAQAQTDTIYVYEDVIVYDTVIIYDTVFIPPNMNNILPLKRKSINILQLDTLHHQAHLSLISDQQTATFSIDHIILDENLHKNIKISESMKKMTFFGVVFFAFQAMILAQTHYEVSVGSGIWWENGSLEYVDKPYSALFNVGLGAKRNFSGKRFGLKTGVEYRYLLGSNDYTFDGTIGVWHSENGEELEALNRNYGAGLHHIAIPLLIYFDGYRVQPSLGINYNYLFSGMQTSTTRTEYYSNSHNMGINLGIGLKINQLITLNMEYVHNLTSDFGQTIIGEEGNALNTVLRRSYTLRNAHAKLSLIYSLRKKQK
ncbi:MAG: hypothetical protein CSA95_00075 [Bacteroidetes bacterium]|nr:MAG: hypothetical protein CSA95_00075 [Bacteroidota bacterium]